MPSEPSRYWCYTYYGKDGDLSISSSLPDSATYSVYQMEECPTTKRKHIQGYIEFNKPVKGGQKSKWVSDWIPGAHVEAKAKFSTREEAEHYCRKPCSAECNEKHCKSARDSGNGRIDWNTTAPMELGVQEDQSDKKKRVKQGGRTDLAAAITELKNGTSVIDVIENQPSLAYHVNALLKVSNLIRFKPLERDVKVIVIWGDAECGKSHNARQQNHPVFNKSDGDWWDGYNGEKTIILDDYYGTLKYQELLKVLDRYPYQVPIKGSFVWAQYDTVYITSNTPPDQWYKMGYTTALHRRITEIWRYQLNSDGTRTISNDKPRLDKLLNYVKPDFTKPLITLDESEAPILDIGDTDSEKSYHDAKITASNDVYLVNGEWIKLSKPPFRESQRMLNSTRGKRFLDDD